MSSNDLVEIEILRNQYNYLNPIDASEEEIQSRLAGKPYIKTVLYQNKNKKLRNIEEGNDFISLRIRNLLMNFYPLIIPVVGSPDGASCRLNFATNAINSNNQLISLSHDTQFNVKQFAIDLSKLEYNLSKALSINKIFGLNVSIPRIYISGGKEFGKYKLIPISDIDKLEYQINSAIDRIQIKVVSQQLHRPTVDNSKLEIIPWRNRSAQVDLEKLISKLNAAGFLNYGIRRYAPGLSAVINITNESEIPPMITEMNKRKISNESRIKSYTQANLINLYLRIIGELFSSKRRIEVETGYVHQSGLNGILKMLTDKEKKLVKSEYENRITYLKQLGNNRCEHIKYLKKLRFAQTIEQMKESYDALQPFIGKTKSETEWIPCSYCGYRLMCPHEVVFRKMQIAKESQENMMIALDKFTVKTRLIYCGTCSEILGSTEIDQHVNADINNEKARVFRKKTWSVLKTVMGSVKFNTPTDEKTFVENGTNYLLPFIIKEEQSAQKRRKRILSDDDDGIDPRDTLIAISYVYAYILSLAEKQLSFDNVKPGSPASAYMRPIIKAINTYHGSLLHSIEDLSTEYLTDQIVTAFRKLHSMGSVNMPSLNPEDELELSIDQDPIFMYSRFMYSIDKKIRPDKVSFDNIVGRSIKEVVKKARENMKDPVLSKLLIKRSGLEVPPLGTYQDHMLNESVNIYSGIYKSENKTPESITYNIFADYITGSKPVHRPLSDIMISYANDKSKVVPCFNFKMTKPIEPRRMRLGLLYDSEGKKHNWSVYIYKFKDKDETYEALSRKGVPVQAFIIDTKCSVCGALRSELTNEELDVLEDKIGKVTSIGKLPAKSKSENTKLNAKVKSSDKIIIDSLRGPDTVRWKSDFTIIKKLADIIKVPELRIRYIGNVEGRDVSNLEAEEAKDTEITHEFDRRITNTYSDMINFRHKFNLTFKMPLPAFNRDEYMLVAPKYKRDYLVQKICEWSLSIPKNEHSKLKDMFEELFKSQDKLSKANSFNLKINDVEIDVNQQTNIFETLII